MPIVKNCTPKCLVKGLRQCPEVREREAQAMALKRQCPEVREKSSDQESEVLRSEREKLS